MLAPHAPGILGVERVQEDVARAMLKKRYRRDELLGADVCRDSKNPLGRPAVVRE